jgi:hypothetical protein
MKPFNEFPRIVGAMISNYNQFKVAIGLFQDGRNGSFTQHARAIVRWNDNRYKRFRRAMAPWIGPSFFQQLFVAFVIDPIL